MNPYTLHINLYDPVFLGVIFTGLIFALQLWFTKKTKRAANRFLALALLTMVLWIARVLGIDIGLSTYFTNWSRLPLQFSLALGPLLYFYVLKITRPEYKFRFKDWLHFSPLLLELGTHALEVRDSLKTGAATYDTQTFQQLNPVLHLLAFISVIIYLYLAHRLIERFYRRLKFNSASDRYRYELRWLHNLLIGFGLLWLLWILFTAADYFYYHNQLSIHAYYPLYLLFAVMAVWTAAAAFFRPEVSVSPSPPSFLKPLVPAELKQRGSWLKKTVQAGQYYEDPELSLSLLAERLELTTHELSRIINTVLKKSFNDFINEFRVAEVARKMKDPAYSHLTLLGIAFESGFNSKSTFNRAFRHITGKSAAEYKNELKKERPSYNLTHHTQFATIISYQQTTPRWFPEKLNRNFMIRNYLKIALRNLWRNKAFSAINIIGLALGLAICFLISLFVIDELSYDKFNLKADRIYRVNADFKVNGTQFNARETPPSMASTLLNEYPQIENAIRIKIKSNGKILVKKGNETLSEGNCFYADNALFDVFTLPMIAGDRKSALSQSHSLVISEDIAKKYFNSIDVIGKTMHLDNTTDYKITGVIENTPVQSHLHFDFIKSINELPDKNFPDWSNISYITYLLARPGVTQNELDNYLREATEKHGEPVLLRDLHSSLSELEKSGGHFRFVTIPLTKIHLHSTLSNEQEPSGNAEYVYIFTVIAIFILLIACINFINLSTARSAGRAREVGVRKVLGSNKSQLIQQFLIESIITSCLAIVIAVIIAALLLPYLNDLSGKQITLGWLTKIWFIPVLILITLVIGVIAG